MGKKLMRLCLLVALIFGSIHPVSAKEKVVYLTFDDGPSANTLKVLKLLDEYDAKATFFITGAKPEYFKYITKAYNEGHLIAAHSYTHNYSKIYKSEKAYFNDLGKIEKVIKQYTGSTSHIVRFPGGSSNGISAKYNKGIMTKLVKDVKKYGYEYHDWNVDSTDASGNHVPASKIAHNATKYGGTDLVILMHDTDAKNTTVQALPKILKYYKSHGYTFKTLDQGSYVCHHRHLNN